MAKVILYTCESGVDLMKNNNSFYVWEEKSDTFNFLETRGRKNYPVIVSEEFLTVRHEDFTVTGNSDAILYQEQSQEKFVELSPLQDSQKYSEGRGRSSLIISSNYTDDGVDSWKKAKEKYISHENLYAFFVEMERDGEEIYTSLNMEQAERLISFLQSKVDYIKGE